MNKRLNILLIDDDLKNAMLLKRFLEAENYGVTYANNGRVGWELYSSEKPDLILLDINMPEMNGFELAALIREHDKRTIIFFLTDRTEKADRLKGFSLKGNDYIPKPFYPEELIAKIEERFNDDTIADERIYQLGNTLFNVSQSSLTYNNETTAISVRQAEILDILAANSNHIVNRDTILESVWGDASYSNSLALNVQITYLRRHITDPLLTIISIKKRGYILQIKPA